MEIPIREKKHFALIGYPLGHSISPYIHTELQKRRGIVASYELIEVEPDRLEDTFYSGLRKLDGFNVTIPHKRNIIPFINELSPRAKTFGAVNTVFMNGGKTYGYNTDCIGFTRALGAAGMDLAGRVLVLGSGGASRVFAYESVIAGADTTLAVRRSGEKRARGLADEIERKLNVKVKIEYLDSVSGAYDMIINGTPVGMFPRTDECPVPEELVKNAGAVFDAIYNPDETMLLKYAKKHDVNCTNGIAMLVWQAAAAEELWNDEEFEKGEVEEVIDLSKRYIRYV